MKDSVSIKAKVVYVEEKQEGSTTPEASITYNRIESIDPLL
jgi:hypothetical protein